MRTSKAYSTISYNTLEFIKTKLEDLIRRDGIAFYALIYHHAEEDEEKDHIHVYIAPNGQIDTNAFRDYLKEVDPKKPGKPLACLPCQSSKWQDWYLYALHDTQYLLSKGQTRKYHYTDNDFVVSDRLYFTELKHQMDLSKFMGLQRIKEAVESNLSFEEFFANGGVPVQLTFQYKEAFNMIMEHTHRGARPNHEIDPDTGEVMKNDEPEKKE